MLVFHEGTASHRRGLAIEEFENRFLEVCEAHRAQGRAWAFAFILFDSRHPQVRKVLQDDAYWDSLDAIAGTALTVFSFEPPGKIESGGGSGSLGFLVEVSGFRREEAERFWHHFDEGNLAAPCVLFFQVHNAAVTDARAVVLQSEAIEECFQELKAILQTAVEAVRRVDPDVDPEPQDVFNLIKMGLEQRAALLTFSRVVSPLRRTVEVGVLLRWFVEFAGSAPW